MMKIDVPIWPMADEKEELALKEVLQSHAWWRNQGYQVKMFEKEFSAYHNVSYGVGVTNGTVAIEVALKSLGVGNGDEVIVPDFTFFSTVSAVLAVNATPVFVDVLLDTFCIDPGEIERVITKRTKAIIPVHIAGHICNMDLIRAIAKKYGLYIIEDCSHAHGASCVNGKAGSYGDLATFSFQSAKLMTAGEGGIIIGNNKSIMEKVFLETNCGRAEDDTSYNHISVGTNARMNEFQGAILRKQLERLETQAQLRCKNYDYLCTRLEEVEGIKLQKIEKYMSSHSHYMIMFYYDKKEFRNVDRREFIEYLNELGIPANRSYEALHRLPIIKYLNKNKFDYLKDLPYKRTEAISEQVVCLAHNVLLGDFELIDKIVEIICQFKKQI